MAYELGQNYPNPFNPSTTIRFSVPEAGLVTLKVYNLLGEEVATLLNNEQAAGVYEANFDASRLSSGIYFYTLEAKNFTSTKKMVLLK
ncbi:MAG: T9SS type A sorting domain-containing protein [Ignavibacteriales bacterium]|nr:T9SS type A sorting domain-containing protein [Ignavibacteriales bacterium]